MSKRRHPWQKDGGADLIEQIRRVAVTPPFIIGGVLIGIVSRYDVLREMIGAR